MPYRSRGFLLTPGELRFYKEGLLPAVGDRYLISFKVRLADVITVDNWISSHGRKIAQKHVDFILASPSNSQIVAAIELNDASHLSAKRRARDSFLRSALRSAAVPLVSFPVYETYKPSAIGLRIGAECGQSRQISEFAQAHRSPMLEQTDVS